MGIPTANSKIIHIIIGFLSIITGATLFVQAVDLKPFQIRKDWEKQKQDNITMADRIPQNGDKGNVWFRYNSSTDTYMYIYLKHPKTGNWKSITAPSESLDSHNASASSHAAGIAGNSATSTALLNDPADCGSGYVSRGINASGGCQAAYVDITPTNSSTNTISSDAVYDGLDLKAPKTDPILSGSVVVDGNSFSVGSTTFNIVGSSVGIRTTIPRAALEINGDFITKGPYVDVRAYGATGDGSTDDTAAIQAALNYAGSTVTVYFPQPSSFYKITSTLTTSSPLILGTKPWGSKIKNYSTGAAINLSGGSIENMQIDGSGNANSGDGIIVNGILTTLKNTYIYSNGGNGIFINNVNNIVIDRCWIEGNAKFGILSSGQAHAVRILNGTFVQQNGGNSISAGLTTGNGGISIQGGHSVTIRDSVIQQNNVAEILIGSTVDSIRSVIIDGNYFEGSNYSTTTYAVLALGYPSSIGDQNRIQFTNNMVAGSGGGGAERSIIKMSDPLNGSVDSWGNWLDYNDFTNTIGENNFVFGQTVSIGTTTSNHKLNVLGNISETGVIISSGTGTNYFAGTVGIGAYPTHSLDIYDSGLGSVVPAKQRIYSSGGGGLYFTSINTNNSAIYFDAEPKADGTWSDVSRDSTSNWLISKGTGLYFNYKTGVTSGNDILLGTWNNSLTLGTDGKVGISTVSPQTTLDVSGDAQFGTILKSTISTTGDITLAQNADLTLSGASAYLATGSSNTLSGLTTAGNIILNNYLRFNSQTKVAIRSTIDPVAVGEAYFCSDCSAATICISTGTAIGDFSDINNRTTSCN